jgi:hypothetical protein
LINGEIYAGGGFTKAGNDSANRIAKWNGTNWEKLGSGMTPSQWGNPIVQTIIPLRDDIYCGGTFEVAGGKPSSFLARWSKWGEGIQESHVIPRIQHLTCKISPIHLASIQLLIGTWNPVRRIGHMAAMWF